jgi:hypothetical protein
MPLPTFKTQDEVPEPFRSEYEERDGEWVAKAPEQGPTRKQIEAREAAALKRAKDAEAKLAEREQELAAKTAGVSPEELQQVRLSVAAEYDKRVKDADARIHELTFGTQINALLAGADVVDLDDARTVFGSRFELSEAGTLVPKDDKSVPAAQFLASLRTEKPHLFKGTQAQGGGAQGAKSGVPKGKLTHEEFQKMSISEKDAYIKATEKAA